MVTRNALSLALGLFLGLAFTTPPIRAQEAQEAPATPSLYERLGAYDGIAAFVDVAFPRVAAHPDLELLFRGHAVDTNIRQRQLIVDKLCHDTGGPCAYTGRPLRTVHTGLEITAEQWKTFIGIITTALKELGVAGADRRDLLMLFEDYRTETVGL